LIKGYQSLEIFTAAVCKWTYMIINLTKRFCKNVERSKFEMGTGACVGELWGQMLTPELLLYLLGAEGRAKYSGGGHLHELTFLQTSLRRTSLSFSLYAGGITYLLYFNIRDLLSRVLPCNFGAHTHQNSSAPLILRPSRHSNELIWLIRDGVRLCWESLALIQSGVWKYNAHNYKALCNSWILNITFFYSPLKLK
jgi:hypothetical protein